MGLLNVVLNATFISALYAIIAIGFTLIFGVGGVLNFAHGALITVGAFAAYLVANPTRLDQPEWVGLLAAPIVTAIVGAIIYMGVVRHVEDQPVTLLILTFVIGFFIQHALRIFVKNGTISVSPLVSQKMNLLGQSVLKMNVVMFVISWVIILGVFVFVNYTETGQAILAVSMTKKGASLVGIDSQRINLYTWMLASAFAGIAGVLLMMRNTGSWNMGTSPLILAFSIVILGGLGSIRGSVVGAYVIGFTETFTTSYVSTKLTGLASLVLLIVFLLVKPEGLFGREAAE